MSSLSGRGTRVIQGRETINLLEQNGDLGFLRVRIDRGDIDTSGMRILSITMDGSSVNPGNSPSTTTVRTAGLSALSLFNRVTFPPTDGVGSTLFITSTSANDTNVAGTHARKVFISGIGADWEFLTETINMNGQTGVATSSTNWIRVNSMFVNDIGANGNSNDGTIFLSLTNDAVAGIPQTDVVYNIKTGYGVSFLGVASTKNKERLYFTRGSYYVDATGSKPIRNTTFTTTPADTSLPNINRIATITGELNVATTVSFNTSGSFPIPPNTDCEFIIQSGVGTNNFSIFWNTLRVVDDNF